MDPELFDKMLDKLELLSRQLGARDTRTLLDGEQPSPAPTRAWQLTPSTEGAVQDLIYSVFNRDKIGAIKAVRQLTGCGLKEAKDCVEARWI